MNPIAELIDNWLAIAVTIAGMVLIVYHFPQLAQGTGTLLQGYGSFAKTFEQ